MAFVMKGGNWGRQAFVENTIHDIMDFGFYAWETAQNCWKFPANKSRQAWNKRRKDPANYPAICHKAITVKLCKMGHLARLLRFI